MPKFNVMVNRTRTIEYSVEIEVSARDEESAEEKVQSKLDKAVSDGRLEKSFDWEESSEDDSFEFDISES